MKVYTNESRKKEFIEIAKKILLVTGLIIPGVVVAIVSTTVANAVLASLRDE